MRNLTQALTLTSMTTAVRSAFKIASVNHVLWWDAESHRAGLAGGVPTLFQDAAGTSAATAVEQPVGLVRSMANAGPRRNLLTYSEQFDNSAWAKGNCSVVANASLAPDGTMTADKLVEDTVNTQHIIRQPLSTPSVLCTFSVYLKAGERQHARVYAFTFPPNDFSYVPSAYINLTTGAVTNSAGCTVSVVSVGGGWWRVRVSTTTIFPSKPQVAFFVAPCSAPTADSYAGDGVSGIFVWGAQLEAGPTATSYQRVTSGVEYLDALQATSTARPLLRARSNFLDISENIPGWGAPGGIVLSEGGMNPYGRPAHRLTVVSSGVAIIARWVGAIESTFVEVSFWVRKGNFTSREANEWGVYDNTAGVDRAFVRVNYDTLSTTVSRGSVLSHGVMEQAAGGWLRIFIRFAHPPGNQISIYLGAIGGGVYSAGDYWSFGGASVNALASASSPSPAYQWSTSSGVYALTSDAPLMLQFDGVDDELGTATFAAGTLPANADVYLVMRRAANDGNTLTVYGQDSARYIGAWDSPASALYSSGAGAPTYRINGGAASGSITLPSESTYIFEARNANLSAWTVLKIGKYGSSWSFSGRIGTVLITPAQSDATRTKIRKALAKAYQVQGVV